MIKAFKPNANWLKLHVSMFVYMYVCMHTRMCLCMTMSTCLCRYVCVCMQYTYIHTRMHT